MKHKIVNIRPGDAAKGRDLFLYAEVHEVDTHQLVCAATLDYILQTRLGLKQAVNYAEALEAYVEFNIGITSQLVVARKAYRALLQATKVGVGEPSEARRLDKWTSEAESL